MAKSLQPVPWRSYPSSCFGRRSGRGRAKCSAYDLSAVQTHESATHEALFFQLKQWRYVLSLLVWKVWQNARV